MWTGDEGHDLKSAELAAWAIEDELAIRNVPVHTRIGSDRDFADRFGTGLGVIREALEILDVRGVCVVKRGPGGGVFSACPDLAMTAQQAVNYLLRIGTTIRHLRDAQQRLDSYGDDSLIQSNPVLQLYAETLRQLESSIPADYMPDCREGGAACDVPLADVAQFTWERLSPIRISAAKSVAWSISREIADGRFPTGSRIGSEGDLSDRYNISRGSMRHATRLLETFGIAEVRPGRGNGLMSAAPRSTPVIRAMISHLLSFRVSGESWSAAMRFLGTAALDKTFEDHDRLENAFEAGRHLLRYPEGGDWLPRARSWLRSVAGLSENPIGSLFWQVTAGYTFRAFGAAREEGSSGWRALVKLVPDIIQAGLDRDRASAIAAYEKLFSHGWQADYRIAPDA